MADFINYLLQVCAVLIILYLPYHFLFRKECRFSANRFYLLAVLIVAWIIPVINIPFSVAPAELQLFPGPIPVPSAASSYLADISQRISVPENLSHSFNWLLIYWAGVSLMLIRNLWVFARILRLSHRLEQYRASGFKIHVGEDLPAFTFFRRIFLSRAENELADKSLVLRHESAHARQWHTLDLILAEFIHTVLWFNPILLIYKKALKETHEYLADRTVLNEGIEFQQYAISLQTECVQSRDQKLVNHFKGSTVKNRIIMASKSSTPNSIWKYLLIAPVLLGCLILWSFIQDPFSPGSPAGSAKNLVVIIDPGHGGKDPGGTNQNNTRNEKDFNLALAKKLETVPHKGIDFIFTRNRDDFATLGSRYTLAEKNKADLFISLHMNANRNSKVRGSELWYSTRNPFAEVSREICRKMGRQLKARNNHSIEEPFSTVNPVTGTVRAASPLSTGPFSTANLVVLSNTNCPSVYYSFGYITNDEDAKTFSDPKNQEVLAVQIINILREIKKEGVLPVK